MYFVRLQQLKRTSGLFLFVLLLAARWAGAQQAGPAPGTNPVIRNVFTADPAALVYRDTVFLYVGHDEAKGSELFTMNEWLCYSSTDMKNWTPHGPIMRVTDFKWAVRDAWAAQVVEKAGKFYLYATAQHDASHNGKAIGVAVADRPTGPFVDARGTALITEQSTPGPNGWDDIDPTVLIDDDGTPWLAWGNPNCYLAKLKPNMTELDGPIQRIHVPNYTEGPWLHKRNGLYYLTYASFAHQGTSEKICYATAPEITGPWTYRGILTGNAKNSYTIHPAIIDYKGQSYLFYHHAALTLPDGQTGATGRRAVCVDYLFYNSDGTMQPVRQTEEGLSLPPKPVVPTPVAARKSVSAPGVSVVQHEGPGAEEWSGKPAFSTLQKPGTTAILPESFNRDGGATSIGQTFTVNRDTRLGRIALYAGDGLGADEQNTVTLALYDLGAAEASDSAKTYTAGSNLLGGGKGLRLAYEVQAPGLLSVNLNSANQVMLKAGHRYAVELQGEQNSASLFWRKSRSDVYAAGAAYRNRKLVEDQKGQTGDFALAIYEAK